MKLFGTDEFDLVARGGLPSPTGLSEGLSGGLPSSPKMRMADRATSPLVEEGEEREPDPALDYPGGEDHGGARWRSPSESSWRSGRSAGSKEGRQDITPVPVPLTLMDPPDPLADTTATQPRAGRGAGSGVDTAAVEERPSRIPKYLEVGHPTHPSLPNPPLPPPPPAPPTAPP